MFFINVKFNKLWEQTFRENPNMFSGLYNSILKISEGTYKNPDKAFHELWQRAHLKWEGASIDIISKQVFDKIAAKKSDKAYKKTACRLLNALKKAGFTHDKPNQTIKLTGSNILAYTDWDGDEIYEDDIVSVMMPAWYCDGKVAEQGICTQTKEK